VDAKHLTSDEIQLVAQSRAEGQIEEGRLIPEDLLRHVDSCQTCGRLVSMQVDFRRKLTYLRSTGVSPAGPDCPESEKLWDLACGSYSPEQSRPLLVHAAACDRCGHTLRLATEYLDQELTPEERNIAVEVQHRRLSTHPRMAHELAALAERSSIPSAADFTPRGRPWFGRLVMALSGTTALLLASYIGIQTVRHNRPSYAEDLIAQAYASARPFEPRIRGAAFAPLKIERGSGRSQTEHPPELLEAEALVARKLSKTPNDPDWLRIRGQADLLDGRYKLAIDAFQRALDLRPDAAELQVDLATALYQKDRAENSSADFATATDLLSRAVQKNRADQVAIFNRAIVLEQLFLFDQAIEDWQQYLKLDSSSAWATEAKQRLAGIERKKQQRERDTGRSLLSPTELQTHTLTSTSSRWPDVDQRVEEYLSRALRDWIPSLRDNSQPTEHDSASEPSALNTIAGILATSHGDSWLKEFLSTRSSPHFERGALDLRNAILSSDQADYTRALTYAAESERLFRIDANVPGLMRAKFERIYALQFSNNGLDCAEQARLLEHQLANHQYLWIREQTMIEEGICRNLLGEFGRASTILRAAAEGATLGRYPLTSLRASVMQALVFWDAGKSALAWQKLRESAAHCWDSRCPDRTLYGVYANMDNFAEDSMFWHLQVFAARQAVVTAKSDPDFLMRAVEHSRLASAAALAGIPSLAREHFDIADRLLTYAPHTPVTTNYQAGIDIDLAKLAVAQEDSRIARSYLERAETRISNIADYYLLANFFLTKAKLQSKDGAIAQAEFSLRWATALAEHQLRSLASQKDRLVWSQQNGEVYRELVALQLNKGNMAGGLEQWEWFLASPKRLGSPTQFSQVAVPAVADVFVLNRRASPPPSLPQTRSTQEILRQLRGQTLVSYAFINNRLGAWILDDRGVDFHWLASDPESVVRLARSFVELCSNPAPHPESFQWQASRLYTLLVSPLEERLPRNRPLLIDGEPVILSIPFAALLDAHDHYLLEKFPISVTPGTYLLPLETTKDSVASSTSAVIVDAFEVPAGEQGIHPLPTSTAESDVVAAKFHLSTVLRGSRITPETLKREIRHAIVFHYGGHSSPDEAAAGLLLPGRRPGEAVIFDSENIRSLGPIPTRIVVLSACATVNGRNGSFADEDSLPQAFLDLGVPHVIASRWNVDSAATARLMAEFYTNLLSGNSVAESLRQAELKTALLPDTSAPYFWAAFSSYGTS
jgi:CHAT domain-containing protein/tetratricopeptide (TPR) repeat protein